MSTVNHSDDDVPLVSLFHHRHGVSFGIIPPGVDETEFWKERDSHDPEEEDEYIESSPLDQPYASAPALASMLAETIEALKEARRYIVLNDKDGFAAYNETGEVQSKARELLELLYVEPSQLPRYFRKYHLERGLPDTVASIKADAEFYAAPDGPDACPPGLKQSARATLKAIDRAILKNRERKNRTSPSSP